MDIGLLLIIQSLFDIFLLILVLALYRQVRRLRELPLEETLERLKQAHQWCEELSKRLNPQTPSKVSDKMARVKEEVFGLAAQGLSAEEIANKLGLQEGEVALLLSLKDKKGRSWSA